MTFDIDIQNYTGEVSDSDAVSPAVVDSNSFLKETIEESPVNQEVYDSLQSNEQVREPSKQELNFKAFREEVDRMKAERETEKREYQAQLDLLRANVEQRASASSPEPKNKPMFDGMNESDVPNVAEIRREWEQRESAYQMRLEELQVQQTHPDYAEVLDKYLTPLIKQKPHLAEGFQGARNKALYAYELGKMAQQMQATQQAQTAPEPPRINENAQRIVDNARKPGTLSQAGGQGALSKADYYASMSDQEFARLAKANLDSI